MEALMEHGRIIRNAPHLTSDQEFIIPLYSHEIAPEIARIISTEYDRDEK
jgi:glycerol-3-phosphate dehydrogenase